MTYYYHRFILCHGGARAYVRLSCHVHYPCKLELRHENLGKGALEAAAISRQLHPRFVLVVALSS